MPSDEDFLRAIFGLTLANSEFRHRDHLRLAWLAVRRHGDGAAEEVVTAGIRRFAQHNSHGPLYHDTMTRFWLRLVGHAVSARPEIVDFDEFLAAFPLLLDKSAPLRHWSREAMFGPEARAAWQDPTWLPCHSEQLITRKARNVAPRLPLLEACDGRA